MKGGRLLVLFLCLGSQAGCGWGPRPAPSSQPSAPARAAAPSGVAVAAAVAPIPSTAALRAPPLRLLAESELPNFADSLASKEGLVRAGENTLAYLAAYRGPPSFRIGEREYEVAVLAESIKALLEILKTAGSAGDIDARIRREFDVYQSLGTDGAGRVVFSAYYQPMLSASRRRSSDYRVPLYRAPPDLVRAELSAFGEKYNGETFIGRVDKSKRLVPYFTRGEIDSGKALAGRGLELAWLKDKFDALDLHIQGSGILRFPDGKEMLAKYAATNGRKYNAVGLLLLRADIFEKDGLSHDKLRAYLRAHPEGEDWILARNPRYTFFDLIPLPADGEPFGTIERSLVPGRSIAIDPSLIPLGALAYLVNPSPQADRSGRLLGRFASSRLALCMDTGGAIKGPGRVDIYVGHGRQADTTARHQWDEGRLYILIKKIPQR